MMRPIVLEDFAGRRLVLEAAMTTKRVNVIVGKIGALVFLDSGTRTPIDGYRLFQQVTSAPVDAVQPGDVHVAH